MPSPGPSSALKSPPMIFMLLSFSIVVWRSSCMFSRLDGPDSHCEACTHSSKWSVACWPKSRSQPHVHMRIVPSWSDFLSSVQQYRNSVFVGEFPRHHHDVTLLRFPYLFALAPCVGDQYHVLCNLVYFAEQLFQSFTRVHRSCVLL